MLQRESFLYTAEGERNGKEATKARHAIEHEMFTAIIHHVLDYYRPLDAFNNEVFQTLFLVLVEGGDEKTNKTYL